MITSTSHNVDEARPDARGRENIDLALAAVAAVRHGHDGRKSCRTGVLSGFTGSVSRSHRSAA